MNSLKWRHNERDSVSNPWCLGYLVNCLFMCRSKEASKLRAIGLCEGDSPVTDEFPAQRASYAKNVSIWWRHHVGLWGGGGGGGGAINDLPISHLSPTQLSVPVRGAINDLPISHLSPTQLSVPVQSHANWSVPTPCEQTPPFTQGLLKHSLTSERSYTNTQIHREIVCTFCMP